MLHSYLSTFQGALSDLSQRSPVGKAFDIQGLNAIVDKGTETEFLGLWAQLTEKRGIDSDFDVPKLNLVDLCVVYRLKDLLLHDEKRRVFYL